MQVVVTGASGFVGRALLRLLALKEIDAVGVARSPISDLPVVQVSGYEDTPAADVLIHLAEINDRAVVQAAGERAEIDAVRNLEALISKKFRKVIYASSAAVYGDKTAAPHVVTDSVFGATVYSRLKITCEKMVLEAGGLVARMTNLYGFGMSPNNVISTILSQVPGKGPVKVWDTSPIRDFLWVDDAAQVLMSMAWADAHGVYNVGSGVGTSVDALASLVLKIAGEQSRPIISVQPAGRPSVNIVDISATTKEFGWKPRIKLEKGIKQLIDNRLVVHP